VDPRRVAGTAFLGELGLDGSIRPVRGVLPVDAVKGESDADRARRLNKSYWDCILELQRQLNAVHELADPVFAGDRFEGYGGNLVALPGTEAGE